MGVKNVSIYSAVSGVRASVEIVKETGATGGDWFQVSDSEVYNKLYFVCAGHVTDHNTAVGEKWVTETNYNITVG